MSTNFVVTSLPAYVAENKDLLIKNFALVGGGSRSRMSIQTGVKYKEHLNYLQIAPVLQSGADCGFSASGDITLTDRTIECPSIKVNLDVCPRKLIGKYAEYLVRNNATENELPFEAYIMQGVVDEINKKIEKLIWQGDKSQTTNTDLKWIDGLVTAALADASVPTITLTSVTSAYEGILAAYMGMTEETLDRGAEIYVSPAIYRVFVQELVEKNYYHYAGPQEAAPEEVFLPGTDVKVVKTQGLAGCLSILGTFKGNFVYGCDMENDAEDIDLWFSQDDRVFKLEVLWNSGVNYYFPDQVVKGTFSAAPTL